MRECKACKEPLSNKATVCRKCGEPHNSQGANYVVIFLVVVLLIIAYGK